MNKTYSLDGVQAILSYPFKAAGWQSKFAIGVALFFANYVVPIVPGIFIAGYFAKIMQASITADEAEPTLPEWDNWGDLFSRGFKVFCASTIYMLPALLLVIGGYLLAYIPLFIDIMSSSSRYGHNSDLTGFSVVGMVAGLGMLFLGLILYMPLMLLLPLAITHLVAKNSFVAAFRIREWWAIFRANFWGFFAALAVSFGVYTVLLLVVYAFYFTIVLCFVMPIGVSVIIMYLTTVSAPLLGEAYRKGVDNLSAASI